MGVSRLLGRLAGAAVQALVGAVVPDACHLCGRRYDPSRAGLFPPARFAAAALAPAGRAGGWIRLQSHPLCACCLRDLETDGAPAVIGRYGAAGRVVLASGEAFGGGPEGTHPLVAVAPFRTNPVLLEAIHRVKFAGVRALLDGLAAAAALALADWQGRPHTATLVPVPMDGISRRRRGFNQSEEIARGLALATGWPVAPGALARPRGRRPQSLTPRDDRAANARAGFRAGREDVAGQSVLLVDDLITTGCTAAACTSVLLAAGAREVAVIGVGRAA